MSKLRLTMTLWDVGTRPYWRIDNSPEGWDNTREVLIDVNEFKRLSKLTNDEEELAQLVMDWVKEDEINKEYYALIDYILINNRVDD